MIKSASTRRRFFFQTARLSLLGTGFPFAIQAALRPIRRRGGAFPKVALNAYTFSDLLTANLADKTKGLDLFGVCDFCAEINLSAVDLTGYFFPGYPAPPRDGFVNEIKRHAHCLGLEIGGTGVRNDFTAADKAIRQEGVEIVKNWVEVAARLGAPTLRVFADSQKPFKNWREASGNADRRVVEEWVADALRECAEQARKFGVMLVVQNHGDFISTGEEHLSLLRRVDHEWCMAMVDTGQYLTDDPYRDIKLMAPYAANWQVKEHLHNKLTGERTDFKKLAGIIQESGYRGNLPVETLAMGRKDYDPFKAAKEIVAQLRDALRE